MKESAKSYRNRRIGILGFLCCILLFSACGTADISAYEDQEILIIGLEEEDFFITPGELMEMKCVSATAEGQSEKAGTVHAYGPTLNTFLEQYGRSLEEFKSIRFTASDEYVVTLGKVSWENYEIILSIADGSEALPDYQQPLRVVIPGGQSGNWVRSVVRIEFTEADTGGTK